jgi:hypothetical protein
MIADGREAISDFFSRMMRGERAIMKETLNTPSLRAAFSREHCVAGSNPEIFSRLDHRLIAHSR